MSRFVTSLLVASAVAAVASCRGEPHRPPPESDTAEAPPVGAPVGGGGNVVDGGGVADAAVEDADGGACNALANEGLVVDQNGVVGDPPTGSGGTIADGTYEVTEARIYVGASGMPGPTGQQIKGTLQIAGGTFQRVHQQGAQGTMPQETRTSGTFTTNGSTFTLTFGCPLPSQDQATYSVVQNTLVLTSLVTRESYTFTLR